MADTRYTPKLCRPPSILLDFDPLIRIGETSVRLATVALAAVIAFAIVLAGQLAASTPERGDPDQPFSRRPACAATISCSSCSGPSPEP